jgi:hypothetical protein
MAGIKSAPLNKAETKPRLGTPPTGASFYAPNPKSQKRRDELNVGRPINNYEN